MENCYQPLSNLVVWLAGALGDDLFVLARMLPADGLGRRSTVSAVLSRRQGEANGPMVAEFMYMHRMLPWLSTLLRPQNGVRLLACASVAVFV